MFIKAFRVTMWVFGVTFPVSLSTWYDAFLYNWSKSLLIILEKWWNCALPDSQPYVFSPLASCREPHMKFLSAGHGFSCSEPAPIESVSQEKPTQVGFTPSSVTTRIPPSRPTQMLLSNCPSNPAGCNDCCSNDDRPLALKQQNNMSKQNRNQQMRHI